MSERRENICTTSRVLPKGMKFYRYDFGCPPDTWSANYKSREYQYEGNGSKNKIGAFFFYDNIEDCERTARNARVKHMDAQMTYTECYLTDDIKILDLRQAHIRNMIDALFAEGIDVLRGDFINHNNQKSYWIVRKAYRDLADNADWMKCFKLAKQLLDFWGSSNENGGNYGYFGQQLTDFDNGFIFKQLLEEKGFAGYCFYEGGRSEKGEEAITYSLFSSTSLSQPKKL